MASNWNYQPEINLSRRDILKIWGFWTIPGNKERGPRTDEQLSWAYLTTSKERRRQFLIDIVIYVCSRDDKLDISEKFSVHRKNNPSMKDGDFTVEIGEYCCLILNHIRRTREATRPVPGGQEHVITKHYTEDKVVSRVSKYREFLNSNNPRDFIMFAVFICKFASSLAENDQLHYLKLLIDSAESHMSFFSDKFIGYRELHAFVCQKLFDYEREISCNAI